jgi:hypothetical protein
MQLDWKENLLNRKTTFRIKCFTWIVACETVRRWHWLWTMRLLLVRRCASDIGCERWGSYMLDGAPVTLVVNDESVACETVRRWHWLWTTRVLHLRRCASDIGCERRECCMWDGAPVPLVVNDELERTWQEEVLTCPTHKLRACRLEDYEITWRAVRTKAIALSLG